MKKAVTLLSVATILGATLVACATSVPTEEEIADENRQANFNQVMRVAETNRAGGDLGNAIVFYERAHSIDPQAAEPLVGIADASMRLGSFGEAADAYAKAVDIRPADADLRRAYGRSLLVMGQAEPAAEQYREAVRLAPTDHRSYNGLGVALDLTGDFEGAQKNYIDGLEIAPDNISLRNNMGLSLLLREAFGEAIPLLQSIADSPEATPRNRLNLALAYGLAGDTERAAAIASRDLDPAAVDNNLAYYEKLRAMPPVERANAILRRHGEDVPTAPPGG